MSYNINILSAEAKQRYLKKLRQINMDTCPYLLPEDAWMNDPTKWPVFEYPELLMYLTQTPGIFTMEAMKNRKSLEAYNQFQSGWVRTILMYKVPDANIQILKADVMPSQRVNENPHKPWVSLNTKTCSVINAHCSCMRLGESCTHSGALLFKIEAAVRLGYTRKTCTEESCKRNDDFKEKVTPKELNKIKFYTENSVKNFQKNSKHHTSFNAAKEEPNELSINNFLSDLSKQKRKPMVLHCFSDYCTSFIPTYKPPEKAVLPKPLRDLYSFQNSKKIKTELTKISEEVVEKMKINEPTINYIMDITKDQNQSPLWHEIRTGRITASSAFKILHTNMNNPSKSIIKSICKYSGIRSTSVPSLKWGIDHEKEAINEKTLEYVENHPSFTIKYCGIKLCKEFPFIGASPDGIFECECHNIKKLIEVKCPFSKRNTKSIEEAVAGGNFFIDDDLNLKTSDKYFAQIQIQLFVFDLNIWELIVWTPNWIFSTDIRKDEKFIADSVPVLQQFYFKHIVPELLSRKLENKVVEEQSCKEYLCICETAYNENNEDEDWIGCDAITCKYGWFHYGCVNVKRPPKGKWYCPYCRKSKKSKK